MLQAIYVQPFLITSTALGKINRNLNLFCLFKLKQATTGPEDVQFDSTKEFQTHLKDRNKKVPLNCF